MPKCGDSSSVAAERFLAALDDMRLSGADSVAVSHGGVTVDVLRTLLGDRAVLDAHPELISNGVPGGAITQLRWSGRSWGAEVIAATEHLVPYV